MLVTSSFWPEQVSPFNLVAFTLCRSNCSAPALVTMVQGTVKAKRRHSASSRSSRQVSCHWSVVRHFKVQPVNSDLGGRGGVTHTLAALDLWRGCFSRRTLARSLVRCLAWSILKLKKQKRINNYSMRWEWIGGFDQSPGTQITKPQCTIDLFSLYILFSHFRPRDALMGIPLLFFQ